MAKKKPNYKTIQQAYWSFRSRHRVLGNVVEIKLNEWLIWWNDTGLLNQRGPRPDQYCMSRIDKSRPYSLDNVECITNRQKNRKNRK